LITVLIRPTARGQGVTTSGVTGLVQGSDNKPVMGATVTVVHVPSGTRAVTTTRQNGRYDVSGLRPGGPYTVTVSSPNFTTQSQENIQLDIGASYSADFVVSNEVIKMEAVKVAGSQDVTFDSGAMGTASITNAPQIEVVTSIRQDVQDIQN